MVSQTRCLIGSGSSNRKGTLGLRNMLFYANTEQACPLSWKESLEVPHCENKLAQVKSSEGCTEQDKGERPRRDGPFQQPACPKQRSPPSSLTCASAFSLGEGLCQKLATMSGPVL